MKISQDINYENSIDDFKFFGVWRLDRTVLKSTNFNEKNWGGRVFYEEDYLGHEVEYSNQFFRLGNDKFFEPKYMLMDFTVYDYNNNGDFQSPDFYEFVMAEEIKIDKADDYEYMGDIPLAYFVVMFKEDLFAPVGTQCLLLNENTMLVGVKAKIILAHRVDY